MEQNLFVFVVNFLYNLLFYVIIIESTNNVILYFEYIADAICKFIVGETKLLSSDR